MLLENGSKLSKFYINGFHINALFTADDQENISSSIYRLQNTIIESSIKVTMLKTKVTNFILWCSGY